MSLAIPLFTDLAKSSRSVLYGDVSGEGAFTPGVAKVASNTVTADGVILNLSASVSSNGVVVPQLTTLYNPTKSLLLMGILGPGGTLTGSATLSNLMNVPGLQATLTATPPVLGQAAGPATVTLDYVTANARLRTIVTPNNATNPFDAPPKADVSATTSVGPCVVGARLAADAATGKLTQWSLGANWTRMTAATDENGKGGAAGVGSLAGQQWGVVVTDTAPSSPGSSVIGGPGRSATVSFHQLLHGGETSLAAEYSLPLSGAPGHNEDTYALNLGIARRLETGGLVKARVDHNGTAALLYQQSVPGFGKFALSCQLDATSLTKTAPAVGFVVNVA